MGDERERVLRNRHIVLIGASVGYAWEIGDLAKRVGAKEYTFEYIGEYEFDKSKSLSEVLKRANRPQGIMLKECAAYFPGDVTRYEKLMKGWVDDCLKRGVVPIMVTVAPVREPNMWKIQFWKNIVKRIFFPGKPTVEERLRDVWLFNDWVRSYAAEHGLVVLDLEEALRVSEKDRRLRADLDGGDGLHLNSKAYALLDQIVIPTLNRLNWTTQGVKPGSALHN